MPTWTSDHCLARLVAGKERLGQSDGVWPKSCLDLRRQAAPTICWSCIISLWTKSGDPTCSAALLNPPNINQALHTPQLPSRRRLELELSRVIAICRDATCFSVALGTCVVMQD